MRRSASVGKKPSDDGAKRKSAGNGKRRSADAGRRRRMSANDGRLNVWRPSGWLGRLS